MVDPKNDSDRLGSRALRLEFGDKYEQVISGGLIQQVLPSRLDLKP